MVVYLPPFAFVFLKNARSTDCQFHFFAFKAEVASLSSYCIKHFCRFVNGVIIVLDIHFGRTVKNTLVYGPYLFPPALYSSERVIHCNVIGICPVRFYHRDIAAVKRAIKLNKCLIRRCQTALVFVTSYWFLNRLHSFLFSLPNAKAQARASSCASPGAEGSAA